MRAVGTKLRLNSAYHPQMDGQTKWLNQCFEVYLRCVAHEKPKTWAKWLTTAEWLYNTFYHTSLQMSPFQALYGYILPHYSDTVDLNLASQLVEKFLKEREEAIQIILQNLLKAQSRTK